MAVIPLMPPGGCSLLGKNIQKARYRGMPRIDLNATASNPWH